LVTVPCYAKIFIQIPVTSKRIFTEWKNKHVWSIEINTTRPIAGLSDGTISN